MTERLRQPSMEDDMVLLFEALVTRDPSGAIIAQEARGQVSFAESDTLPVNMPTEAKSALEAAGAEFLGPVPDDPLFQFVRLPSGWRKEPSAHPMWTDLLDNRGRRRAMAFYKAASYDRRANLSLCRRFERCLDDERTRAEGGAVATVTDCGQVIYATAPVPLPGGMENWPVIDRAEEEAKAWLDVHYPDWRNPLAYWD